MKGTVAATSVIKYDRWSASPEVYEGQAEKHDHPDIDIIHVLYTSQTERQAKRTLQEYIELEEGTHEIPSQGREYAGVGEVDKKGSMVSHLSILYTTDSIGRAAAREALRKNT
jgi:hypothetical protein